MPVSGKDFFGPPPLGFFYSEDETFVEEKLK